MHRTRWLALSITLAACAGDDPAADAGRDAATTDAQPLDDAAEPDGALADADVAVPDAETDAAAPDACAGPQPTRLRVTSYCDQPIWLHHSENVAAPLGTRLEAGECYDYPIGAGELASMRLWPKTGCDAAGEDCDLGQSVAPCPDGGCQPPIESKFEATFADADACPTEGAPAECVTWYNASQVDGFTLPFLVRPKGPGSDAPGCIESDCSALDLDQCPSAEDLSQGGLYPEYAAVDLRVLDESGAVVGCMAPCKRLNYPAPWGYGLPEDSSPTREFCCPTPPIGPEECTAGPVTGTGYVNRLQTMCPSVYSYAYDDADGLHTCPAQTQFEVVFCPERR
ncbi:MAG: hypothetical protein CMN30_20050 [Sandaracinus sp.]|nr:hypothetical protein [Sandaracinus sp.]